MTFSQLGLRFFFSSSQNQFLRLRKTKKNKAPQAKSSIRRRKKGVHPHLTNNNRQILYTFGAVELLHCIEELSDSVNEYLHESVSLRTSARMCWSDYAVECLIPSHVLGEILSSRHVWSSGAPAASPPFFLHTHLLSSFWTSHDHRCHPFPPPGSCLQFVSRIGFSNPTDRRFFIECCKLTLSRFPQVNLCTRKNPHEFMRVCTRGDSNSRN